MTTQMRTKAICIVRKFGTDATKEFIDRYAQRVHWFGNKFGYPVYDTHKGTELPEDARDVLFVSLGGDGTMLHASKLSLQYPNSSVVGFNLGHLGFLADANLDDMIFTLQSILGGEATIDYRMVVKATAGDTEAIAMNEFLFAPASVHGMADTRIFINDEPVVQFKGSGVLIATATGSTAMAMSAGGPIISPKSDVILIAPVLAHSLSMHPIITMGHDTVRIETYSAGDIVVSGDGQPTGLDFINHVVEVTKYKQSVSIWRSTEWQFFETLSTKMGWN